MAIRQIYTVIQILQDRNEIDGFKKKNRYNNVRKQIERLIDRYQMDVRQIDEIDKYQYESDTL